MQDDGRIPFDLLADDELGLFGIYAENARPVGGQEVALYRDVKRMDVLSGPSPDVLIGASAEPVRVRAAKGRAIIPSRRHG